MVSAEEPSRSRLDECFLKGRYKAPRQRSSPFFPKVHTSLRYCGTPPIHPSASVAFTSVDGAEEKGYEHLPPLDGSVRQTKFPSSTLRFREAACLDQLWRALLNASQRLWSCLKRCDTSSLSAPAFLLLPVAPGLRRSLGRLTTPRSSWIQGLVMYLRCSLLRSEPRSERFPPRRVARNCPCSAPSGPWGYILSILPHTGNQNSFLSASVTAPKVALLRSKAFLAG